MTSNLPDAGRQDPPTVPPRHPNLINRGNFERAFAAIYPKLLEHAIDLTADRVQAERLVEEVRAMAFSERHLLGRRDSFAAWCEARMRAHHQAGLQRYGHDPSPGPIARPPGRPAGDASPQTSVAKREQLRESRLRVADAMSTPAFVADRDATLAEVSQLMRERSIRHVPIVDADGVPVGMITSGDLARIGVWGDLLWPERKERPGPGLLEVVRAEDIMSRPVRWVHPEDSLSTAAGLMAGGKRHALPVVTRAAPRGLTSEPSGEPGDRILGVVTAQDLLRVAYLQPPNSAEGDQ